MTTSSKTLVVILGPTGSGKTDLAVELAQNYHTEIISADSRQVFRGMPIGTAQPSSEQLSAVKHHFIASKNIDEDFTSGKYEQEALALLDELFKKYDIVIAVGGSGLYIDALCYGLDDLPDADPALRSVLEDRYAQEGLDPFLIQLEKLDPEYFSVVDRSNPRRVMRAVEVCLQTGQKYSQLRKGTPDVRNFNIIKIGVDIPRDALYDRINRRVDGMIAAGLEQEARTLYPHRELNSLQTVGYREFFEYFDGNIAFPEAVELIKRNTRRYAKRQMTWFRRDTKTVWFPPDNKDSIKNCIDKFAR